ncbi:MAG TPA: hypothetical protein VKK31_02280 [Thermoanaerobaculia bacterium]|nr:hypothetical protein [Thermoanaerobaculia bacterium]
MREPKTSEELRAALFTAILDDDSETFLRFCTGYASAIIENFGDWTRVPEEARKDPEAVQAWGHCLMTLARIFADGGLPQLMERLTGGSDNPIIRWRNAFSRAGQLSQAGEYDASNEVLLRIAADMEGARGPAVDDYLPKVFGLLGSNFFRLGNPRQALEYTQLALEDCQRSGDAEGVRVYAENLRVLAAAASAESGEEASARLRRIRGGIARAQDLSDDARFDLSNSVLDEVLTEIGSADEATGAEYRGKIYGLLGLNHFRLNDSACARSYTERALEECDAASDSEGIRVYTANLSLLALKA